MPFDEARALITEAVTTGVSPAAAIEVGRSAGPLWQAAAGALTYDPGAPPAALDTIFDLASLTKVIATTSLVMRAVADERLRLDTPVAAILPAWRVGPHRAVLVRHLLDHSSGLPGRARLWERAAGRVAFEEAIRALPLERAPGLESVYSDLGFMLLGFIVEDVVGRPIDDAFRSSNAVWGTELQFRPPVALRDRIAPTEIDEWRGRLIRREVHDENAAALGGVAGHAGLFGTAPDVGTFARLVLRTFAATTVLGTPGLMRTFATPTGVPGSSRAFGWDTMRPTSSCGALVSPSSIGHTGFTGTSLWIDWERDLYVVLLTNRVHPTRANEQLLALRPRVHDAVMKEVL